MSYKDVSGQSAIEYLMTYGWMLLTVAIVGGAVFSVVQSEDIENISGFSGADVQVGDFGFTQSENLQLIVRNADSNSVSINSVNVSDGEGRYSEWIGDVDVSVADTESLSLAGVSEGSGANSLDVVVNYDSGSLENLEVSGTISGSLEVEDSMTTLATEPDDLSSVISSMEGSGTDSDPYIVSDVYELQAMNESLDSNYVISENINALGTELWNNGKGFNPIGQDEYKFTGTLDGQLYEVDSLFMNRSSETAFIGYMDTSDSLVERIGFVDVNVIEWEDTSQYGPGVAAVVGRMSDGVIDSVYVTGDIHSESGRTASIVGHQGYGIVQNSFSTADITARTRSGGISGVMRGGYVESTYYTGKLQGTGNQWRLGSITGYASGADVYDSIGIGEISPSAGRAGQMAGLLRDEATIEHYCSSEISEDQDSCIGEIEGGSEFNGEDLSVNEMQGSDALDNMNLLDEGNWDAVEDDYPVLQSIDRDVQLEAR